MTEILILLFLSILLVFGGFLIGWHIGQMNGYDKGHAKASLHALKSFRVQEPVWRNETESQE